jgi:7-cyano-7-deazaguanine synthase in queuosine biosynthesis
MSLRGLVHRFIEIGLVPSQACEDFLILAIAVFTADTRFWRGEGDDGWTRQISLSVPVADADAWNKSASRFEAALRFLTGDLWTLIFRKSSVGRIFCDSVVAPTAHEKAKVALFSGGLDSLIGALDAIREDGPLYLVGHFADGSTSVPQTTAFKHVEAIAAAYITPLLVQVRIAPPGKLFGHKNDNRQRSRSFLFIALGTLVANSLGISELRLPENGLISLNVPLNELRLGSNSTRTTHPHFLALLQEALASVGTNLTLHNPYQFKTKGEMLAECCSQDGLLEAAAQTMSCSHPTSTRWSKHGAPALEHCGRCTPCLIRRGAFAHAFGKDPTKYAMQELTTKPLRSDRAEGRDIRAVRMAAMRVIEDPGLAPFLATMPGPLPDQHERYADVYLRGMREVFHVVEHATTKGAY